jgi:hypothetical protein
MFIFYLILLLNIVVPSEKYGMNIYLDVKIK